MHAGNLSADEEKAKKLGTKAGKGQAFICALTGAPIERTYIQREGKAGRLKTRLIAVVADGQKGRIYLPPSQHHEDAIVDLQQHPSVVEARGTFLSGTTPTRAMITGGVCSAYGLATWGDLFTSRQIFALVTLSELITELRNEVEMTPTSARSSSTLPGCRGRDRAPYLRPLS